MRETGKYTLLAALGLALLAGGLYCVKTLDASAAPYLCVGFGCGIFGHGAGELLSRRAAKADPEGARQREVEERDERNVMLRDRAQAKAYNLMLPVFGSLFVAFGLMGVELKVVLLLAAAYVFICCCSVYYRIRYERED